MKITQLDALVLFNQYLFPQGTFPTLIKDKWGHTIGFELHPCSGVILDSSGKIDSGRPAFTEVATLESKPFDSNTRLMGFTGDMSRQYQKERA